MRIVYNYLLPFPGYMAMMFFGVIKARRKYKKIGLSAFVIQHEEIHRLQVYDFKKEDEITNWRAFIRYYCAYLGQWMKYGYRNCPFEQEAYDYCGTPRYLQTRPARNWTQYETT